MRVQFTRRKSFILVAAIAGVAGVAAIRNHYYWYPYGRSHCCDKGIYIGLLNYADAHGKTFPAGKSKPEASLSLLYPTYADAGCLRGKSIPEAVVQAILDKGELLGPDSCGWHYVEGLRSDDDPQLALFWDKAGLDHNGGRLSDGGHVVWFVRSESEYIPAADWDAFLASQTQLLEDVKSNRAKGD